MREPTVYIFVNKGLQMSIGKVASQAAHAMAEVPRLASKEHWLAPHRTVLVMQARDEQHLKNIQLYLAKRKVESYEIIDEGVNETDSHVWTALATQIVDKDLVSTRDIFSTFQTYRDTVRVRLEIDK